MFFTLSPSATEPRLTKESFNRFSLLFISSSRSRHTSCGRDWSSDVCSSDLISCIEAFSCGLVPIISESRRSATTQFALGKEHLFCAGRSSSLAEKIDSWISNPQKLKEEIGRASCRERV